ncbi:hypothetical protein EX30DRAFT_375666 [Ascodesmis nigricans]|uniref:Uncharacterized protein n=1 Tax=Ascodesmis nigricans TaxID=341454 RepID=A0A4S2MH84_9PEZI|nr:hypothetical protein EX30DRAFT_375666 [Ascodesmis nigricans]
MCLLNVLPFLIPFLLSTTAHPFLPNPAAAEVFTGFHQFAIQSGPSVRSLQHTATIPTTTSSDIVTPNDSYGTDLEELNPDELDLWDTEARHLERYRILSSPDGTVGDRNKLKSLANRLPCGCVDLVIVEEDAVCPRVCEHGYAYTYKPPGCSDGQSTPILGTRKTTQHHRVLTERDVIPESEDISALIELPPRGNLKKGDLDRRGNSHSSSSHSDSEPRDPPPPPPNTPVPDYVGNENVSSNSPSNPSSHLLTTSHHNSNTHNALNLANLPGGGQMANANTGSLTKRQIAFKALGKLDTTGGSLGTELAKRRAPPPPPPNTPVEKPDPPKDPPMGTKTKRVLHNPESNNDNDDDDTLRAGEFAAHTLHPRREPPPVPPNTPAPPDDEEPKQPWSRIRLTKRAEASEKTVLVSKETDAPVKFVVNIFKGGAQNAQDAADLKPVETISSRDYNNEMNKAQTTTTTTDTAPESQMQEMEQIKSLDLEEADEVTCDLPRQKHAHSASPFPADFSSPTSSSVRPTFHREFGYLYPDTHQGAYTLSVKGLPDIVKNSEGEVVEVVGRDGEPVDGKVEVVEKWSLKSDVAASRGLVWDRRKGLGRSGGWERTREGRGLW